jgi:long-chain acyl-CoA synthetase
MKAEAVEQFDCAQMYEFYGSSEASYISYTSVQKNAKMQSAQKVFPGVSVKIVDDQDKKVKNGQIGQICVKSGMLFRGYDRRPEETKHVFQDGWLLSEDYGYLDEMAELDLAGRQKNMLITGGLNVYPEEVEMVIKRLPTVEDVMIFGEQDKHLVEKIIAVIAWKNSHTFPASKVKKLCAQYLATYKIPRKIITVKEFLYTSSGKIARKEMIDMVESGNK